MTTIMLRSRVITKTVKMTFFFGDVSVKKVTDLCKLFNKYIQIIPQHLLNEKHVTVSTDTRANISYK